MFRFCNFERDVIFPFEFRIECDSKVIFKVNNGLAVWFYIPCHMLNKLVFVPLQDHVYSKAEYHDFMMECLDVLGSYIHINGCIVFIKIL